MWQLLFASSHLYNSEQALTEYDIYYFLSHIISALHKVLINAFGDEAFTPEKSMKSQCPK